MSRFAILTYHSIDDSGSVISTHPESLARHVAVLAAEGVRAIPLGVAVEERQTTGQWPSRAVAVTFDDGYRNLQTVALPIFAAHGFAATVFLVSRRVGGTAAWAQASPALAAFPLLSWSEARLLRSAGWEIGSHTRTHRDLGTLAADAVRDEVVGSRQDIEDQLGEAVNTFAYPYGHVTAPAARLVEATYRAAGTTCLKRASREPFHALPRVDMYYFGDPGRFRRLVRSGLDGYLAIRRWGRRLRTVQASSLVRRS